MEKVKSLSEICQEHINSLTPKERVDEYISLLERQKFWEEYLQKQKLMMDKWDKLVSELRSKYFMVPGD